MSPNTPGLGLPDHVAVVVEDVDKTVEVLSSTLGIGPWELIENSFHEEMFVGEPFSAKIAKAQLGSVVLELIQPLEEDSLWGQFLKTRGEGLQHIAFVFPNWDEVVSKLKQQGSKMVVGGVYEGKRWCYFDIKPGGILLEVHEK